MTGAVPDLDPQSPYRRAKQAHMDAVCGSQPFKDSGDFSMAEASWFLIQCHFDLVADNMLRAWKSIKDRTPKRKDVRQIVQDADDRALLALVMVLTGGTANPSVVQAKIGKLREEMQKTDLCQDEGCPHHGTEHVCISLKEGDGVAGD